MAVYTCKYCGRQSSSPSFAGYTCTNSPTKHHVLMDATEKLQKYTCKYCGRQSSNPSFAGYTCTNSPHKYHELLG